LEISQYFEKVIVVNLDNNFTELASNNNLFNSKLEVTLDSGPEEALIIAKSSNGDLLLEEKTIIQSEPIYFTIPWNSGTWTLHVKATSSG
jgi:hypothetical protein